MELDCVQDVVLTPSQLNEIMLGKLDILMPALTSVRDSLMRLKAEFANGHTIPWDEIVKRVDREVG